MDTKEMEREADVRALAEALAEATKVLEAILLVEGRDPHTLWRKCRNALARPGVSRFTHPTSVLAQLNGGERAANSAVGGIVYKD